MGIHKLVRREKREWQRIRDVRDLEAVRHGYNELKLTVQTEKPEPYIESIVDQVLELGVGKSDKVLDAGSGSGVVCRHLRERGFTNISAFDISDENVESTRPWADRVFRSTCESIETESDQFPMVICNGVIEHCMDVRQSLRELFRVTSPGGYLYIMTDNAWWQTLVTIKNHFVPPDRRYIRFSQPLDGDFDVSEMEQLLRDCGFSIAAFSGYGGLPVGDGLVSRLFGRPTAQLPGFKRLTSRMIFIAQKPGPPV